MPYRRQAGLQPKAVNPQLKNSLRGCAGRFSASCALSASGAFASAQACEELAAKQSPNSEASSL